MEKSAVFALVSSYPVRNETGLRDTEAFRAVGDEKQLNSSNFL